MAKKMQINTGNLNFDITGNGNPTTGYTEGQIVEIPNDKIFENNNQHFIIHEDTIDELAERIARDGQLSPCIVVPLPDGIYELIDGRHRRRAVIKAGLPTTKCIVRTDLDENQKRTIRLTSNLIRNNDYLPSELAFAYKELLELENNMQKISNETNLSKKKIYRYIRLTNLIEPLLNRVDNGSIPVIAAVELSYLDENTQKKLFEFMLNHSDCKITTANAREIKESPDDLENIFYSKTKNEIVDNLSTFKEEETFTSDVNTGDKQIDNSYTTEEATEKFTSDISSSDEQMDKLSTSTADIVIKDINEIPISSKEVIAKAVIKNTHIDKYIVKNLYTPSEVVSYFNKKYISRYACCYNLKIEDYSINIEWSSSKANGNPFYIQFDNKSYFIKHKGLEEIIRAYIRDSYTSEDMIKLIRTE